MQSFRKSIEYYQDDKYRDLPQVVRPMTDAFDFPCLEHVDETGHIIVEK